MESPVFRKMSPTYGGEHPIHDETLRKILESTKDEPFPTLTPAGPRKCPPPELLQGILQLHLGRIFSSSFRVLPPGGPGMLLEDLWAGV